MLTAFAIGIGVTAGIVLVMLGFALFAKALFFRRAENEGYGQEGCGN